MSEHAQSGETGRVDEAAAPSVASTETTTAGEQQGSETSAETQNTAPTEHMIPKSRLDEVIAKRREAEAERDRIQQEYEQLKAGTGNGAIGQSSPAEPDDPPDHLSPRERARWIVQRDAKQFIEQELGMPLKDAKTLLTTTRTTAEDYAQRTWREGCQRHNLDPANREVIEMVSGLTKAGVKLDEAFSRAGRFYGKQESTQTTGASVETTTGQTGTMSGERIVPRDRQHALELAEKGVSIAHTSSQELIRNAVDKEKERAGPQRIRTIQ